MPYAKQLRLRGGLGGRPKMGRELSSDRARRLVRVGSRSTADLAAQARKNGVDVLKLEAAPVLPLPEHVTEAANKAARDRIGYAPSRGLPELRKALSEKLRAENDIETNPDTEIIITNGGNHGLTLAMMCAIDPGDEVIVPSPCYFFNGLINAAGGVAVYVGMPEEEGFPLRADLLEEEVTPRTKALIVNTPVNPTGHVARKEELEGLAKFAEKHDLLVISDETYEKMLYDGKKHISIASLPGMRKRTVTIQSYTKSFAMTAWRIGYMAAPPSITEQLLKMLEWTVLCCNYVSQKAALAALTGPQEWVRNITKTFEERRDLVFAGFSKIKEIKVGKPEAGPFLFPNVSSLGLDSMEFCRYALTRYGIPFDSGRFLGSDAHVRIPFGCEEGVLPELVSRMQKCTESLLQAKPPHASTRSR
jgi:aspartate/methionine/tyrosine aminotransferase